MTFGPAELRTVLKSQQMSVAMVTTYSRFKDRESKITREMTDFTPKIVHKMAMLFSISVGILPKRCFFRY